MSKKKLKELEREKEKLLKNMEDIETRMSYIIDEINKISSPSSGYYINKDQEDIAEFIMFNKRKDHANMIEFHNDPLDENKLMAIYNRAFTSYDFSVHYYNVKETHKKVSKEEFYKELDKYCKRIPEVMENM